MGMDSETRLLRFEPSWGYKDTEKARTRDLDSTWFVFAEPENCSHNYTELSFRSRSGTLTSLFKWEKVE